MQRVNDNHPWPIVIVLGCDEVGSAIAHRLHGDGHAVVLVDRVDPPWPRRGMSFTDAWYTGASELSGTPALFCASVRSIPSVLNRYRAIAATTRSWTDVASALSAVAMIETRPPSERRAPPEATATSPVFTIEVVPGAIAGPEFDIAIPTPAHERITLTWVLHAPSAGRFTTNRSIGERVRPGDPVGAVGGVSIVAPLDGSLRGLAARGARVSAGAVLVEIDPRGDPSHCYGIGLRAGTIAAAVSDALAVECSMRPAASSRGVYYRSALLG